MKTTSSLPLCPDRLASASVRIFKNEWVRLTRPILISLFLCLTFASGLASDAGKAAVRKRHDAPVTVNGGAGLSAKSGSQSHKRSQARKHSHLAGKLESRLIDAWEQADAGNTQAVIQALKQQHVTFAENGEAVVLIVSLAQGAKSAEVELALKSKGATVIRTGGGTIKVAAPISSLSDVATTPGVTNVRTVRPPRHKNTTQTEGLSKTLANVWHSAGFTGQGVKVAIVDMSFANLATLKAQDELPAAAVEVNYTATSMTAGSSSHGSACAEILYDLAPGAQMHLIKIDDVTDLIAAKDYCVANGIKVVSCSLGWDAMNFHDGVAHANWFSTVANHPVTAANLAATNDIVWVVPAGNEQRQHTLIDWRDGGTPDSALDWNASYGNVNVLWLNGSTTIPAGTFLDLFMTWNRWPNTDQDFDLILLMNTGSGWNQVTSGYLGGWTGDDYQPGGSTSYPYEEIVCITPATAQYGVLVARFAATTSPTFILRYYGVDEPNYFGYGNVLNPPPGSISIPGDAASAFTVGAIDEMNYPSGPTEFFSSLGPNNRAYTGGTAATKPDICGPDWTTSVTYGSGGFVGTSASAPHVAGLAALVRGACPGFTQAQTRNYLEANAFDPGPLGKDNTYGSGAARLPAPTFSLAISRNGGAVTLTWNDCPLQQADNVAGPYTNVPGAVSPHTVAASGAQKFYRSYYLSQ